MKAEPVNIILNKDFSLDKKFYFISGNEITLIEKIRKLIIERYQKDKGLRLEKIDSLKGFSDEKDLFQDNKIFLIENINGMDEQHLLEAKKNENIYIFVAENSQKIKKIKNIFIKDRDSYLFDCYELSVDSKIKIVNNYLNKNGIEIKENLYWYLVEKLDNRYMFLENSLKKILDLNEKKIILDHLKRLLTTNDSGKEKVFFYLLKKNDEIIKIYRDKILTLADVNEFYYYCKYFCQLIIDCKNEDEYNKNIPKYLFKERGFLINMYKRYNYKKKKMLLKLLRSTEIILRNENNLSLISGLRFLLTIKKITIS